MSNDELSLDLILAHSCPHEEFKDGSKLYHIELHCVTFSVIAQKIDDGVMDQNTGKWVKVPHFWIISYSMS